jgi:hypothetical protein
VTTNAIRSAIKFLEADKVVPRGVHIAWHVEGERAAARCCEIVLSLMESNSCSSIDDLVRVMKINGELEEDA